MRDLHAPFAGARTPFREVRTAPDAATQRRLASAIALSITVGRLTRERVSS